VVAQSIPPAPAPIGWRLWLQAIRPRILPASVSPIFVGTGVAIHEHGFRWLAAVAALLTAMLLQIVSNLANDVFDFHRGADQARLGPTRMTQSGLISPRRMLIATWIAAGLATLTGVYLVWIGGWPVLALGLGALLAAFAYTAGPFPLGYHALGEVFVFLFFGFAAVTGSAFLQTGAVTGLALIAAIPMGCLICAIIVVNNLRDIHTDAAAGKRTMAVRLGVRGTRFEYLALLTMAYLVPAALALHGDLSRWVFWLPFTTIPLALQLTRGIFTLEGRPLNKMLGGTARLTLLFGLLFTLAIALS
jgi:1,4-dihydroxy-2-naphthoate octaprenyltransferase